MSQNSSLAKVETMLLNLVRNLNIITAKYLQETTTEDTTEGIPLCIRNHNQRHAYKKPQLKTGLCMNS